MTAEERVQIATVLAMVQGIAATLGNDDSGLVKRVRVIEEYVSEQKGADGANAQNAERRTSESRWRKGVAVSIGLALIGTTCSVLLGLANLALAK